MNSKYEKRLSLEELTKLNKQTPKEEPRTIQISEEEWTRLSALLQRMEMLTEQKNIDLFTRFGVLSETEIHARREILLENYAKVLNIEAQTMIDIAGRDIIPAVTRYAGRVFPTLSRLFDVNFIIPDQAQFGTVIGTALSGCE